jgi:hypothetical protein
VGLRPVFVGSPFRWLWDNSNGGRLDLRGATTKPQD